MDLPIAAAYMDVTNEVTKQNMETLAILAETRELKKKAKALEEEGKRLDAEHERLVAEGERLKAEGEAIDEQIARNKVWKENKAQYEDLKTQIVESNPVYKKRVKHTRLLTLRNNVGQRIKQTAQKLNMVVIDSAIETQRQGSSLGIIQKIMKKNGTESDAPKTLSFDPQMNVTQALLQTKKKPTME